MAELKKIRFLLFSLSMIFPAHALDVLLSSANGNFKQKSEIKTNVMDGEKIYCGTLYPLTYRARPHAFRVIVYIIDKSRFVEIMRDAVREIRSQIADELKEHNCELVFLGIDNFDDDEYHLISAFMLEKIQPHNENEGDFAIETIGENHFNRAYGIHVMEFEMYQENAQICGGTLRAHLRNIPRGALRPVESNNKKIRLFDYNRDVKEVKWHVNVVNGTYFPKVDVNVPKYNFKIKYPDKKICLLILGGKEYSTAIRYGELLRQETEASRILDEMTSNDEVLLILGAFHFDWTEIDIVAQIIHRHTEGWQGWNRPADNVFTCGYGMFNTAYLLNVSENNGFEPQPESNVSQLIKVLMGEEVGKRAINMYSLNDVEWEVTPMPINSGNGRYMADEQFIDYTFPWVDQKFAFIVYDTTEQNETVDHEIVHQNALELEWSGIRVILIEAINFGLDDIHIVAEWIDYHRKGVINSNRIAVLGGGIFDTIFQSESTTYKTLHNTNKDQLKEIRDAYVKSSHGKRVFAAQIDDPVFDVWTYPMDTVNGHYEPDLIPDKNMFDTSDGRMILFIITSANRFHRIARMQNVEQVQNVENVENLENLQPLTLWLREAIEQHYPLCDWTVFLVGLDNFGGRDNHLFAELVERQTHDERSLDEFVRTCNYDTESPVYQYKHTQPFPREKNSEIRTLIKSFFRSTR